MADDRVADIIATAISREEEAYAFYMGLLDKIDADEVRQVIGFIAEEEQKHRQFLVDYRDGKYGSMPLRMADVVYYRIAEHQKEPEIKTSMAAEDVFLLAAHREKKSHAFYTELAGLHDDGDLRDMLLRIANEELKHKEKMEYLYSNTAFPQTSGG